MAMGREEASGDTQRAAHDPSHDCLTLTHPVSTAAIGQRGGQAASAVLIVVIIQLIHDGGGAGRQLRWSVHVGQEAAAPALVPRGRGRMREDLPHVPRALVDELQPLEELEALRLDQQRLAVGLAGQTHSKIHVRHFLSRLAQGTTVVVFDSQVCLMSTVSVAMRLQQYAHIPSAVTDEDGLCHLVSDQHRPAPRGTRLEQPDLIHQLLHGTCQQGVSDLTPVKSFELKLSDVSYRVSHEVLREHLVALELWPHGHASADQQRPSQAPRHGHVGAAEAADDLIVANMEADGDGRVSGSAGSV